MSTNVWYKEVARLLDQMGVSYEFEKGGKHTKVWIEKDGKKGLVVISVSPSDHRSLGNVKKSVKRALA